MTRMPHLTRKLQTCVKFSAPVKLQWVDGKVDKIHKIGSLQEMSAFTVLICLYRRLKLDLYCDISHRYCLDPFLKIYGFVDGMKDMIINSVSELPLPLKLQRRILHLRLPIGVEYVSWIVAHINDAKIIELQDFLPQKLVWKSNGTVDNRKTAEIFMRDDGIDIWKRFILACMNCLENYIYELWPFVKYDVRATFIDGKCEDLVYKEADYSYNFLLKYWISCCEASSQLNEKYYSGGYNLEFELSAAAFCNNLTAVEYFLWKSKPEAVKEVIIKFCEIVLSLDINFPDVLIPFIKSSKPRDSLAIDARGAIFDMVFLMLSDKEKWELFKKDPFSALESFRRWPHVDQFMEIANHLYPYLSVEQFYCICLMIIGSDTLPRDRDTFHDAGDIFLQFWLNTPKVLREKLNFDLFLPFTHVIVIFRDRSRSGKFIRQILDWFRQDPSSVTCIDLFFVKSILLIFTDPTRLLQLEQNITCAVQDEIIWNIKSYQKAVQKINKNLVKVFDAFPKNFLDLCETYYEIINELIDV